MPSPSPAAANAPPTTAALVRRALTGDVAALDLLARRHLRACYVVALGIVKRPADADDVAQEAFVVALERLEQCDPERFPGWLLTIVRTRALNALERRRLRDPREDQAVATTQPFIDDRGDILLRDQLAGAIGELSQVQRETLLLHDLEGWTHAEISALLGITEVNCRQHLFSARRALRGKLSRQANDGASTPEVNYGRP